MKKQYPKARVRREFRHLEAQVEEHFDEKAWRQFYEAVVNGELPEKSYQDQYKLVEQIRKAHARRDRWNQERRRRKWEKVLPFLARPEYFMYVAAGLVKSADWMKGAWQPELASGAAALDLRHVKKFVNECEIVREMVEPRIPVHQIDQGRARAEASGPVPVDKERATFVELLKPTPMPDKEESVVVFSYPESDNNNNTTTGEFEEETDRSHAA